MVIERVADTFGVRRDFSSENRRTGNDAPGV